MVAVDAGRVAAFIPCTDRERVAGQRNRPTEPVIRLGVGCLDVGLLDPLTTTAGKDVDRAAVQRAVVALVAVDAGRVAVFRGRADREGVAGQRNRIAEQVTTTSVGCLEVGVIAPFAAGVGKDVDRAAVQCVVVALVAVDAGRGAAFILCADRECAAGQRNRIAELVPRAGVGGLEVGCLLGVFGRIDVGNVREERTHGGVTPPHNCCSYEKNSKKSNISSFHDRSILFSPCSSRMRYVTINIVDDRGTCQAIGVEMLCE